MPLTKADLVYLERCNQLALNALGNTYPNPIVGAVLICDQKIIGESYHVQAGKEHAEVGAINQVKNQDLLSQSTLYVSLEPCNHQGKTPACTHLIVQKKIPKVVIDCIDPNPLVNHSGIDYLQQNGVEVLVNKPTKKIHQNLNKRFFTYHLKKRPYIILKWAQSADGFIDSTEKTPISISDSFAKQLSHKWRTEEQAILIGKTTYLKDNPQLNPRLWKGNDNHKFVIDRNLVFPKPNRLFEQKKVYVFNELQEGKIEGINYLKIDFNENTIAEIIMELYHLEIQSIIIEGGRNTLQQFIDLDLWDEARVFTNPNLIISQGTKAPNFQPKSCDAPLNIGVDRLQTFYNG